MEQQYLSQTCSRVFTKDARTPITSDSDFLMTPESSHSHKDQQKTEDSFWGNSDLFNKVNSSFFREQNDNRTDTDEMRVEETVLEENLHNADLKVSLAIFD